MSSKNNSSLHKAKEAKYDEWYTRFEDISAEVSKYAEQLRGKVIYCPCDWDESLERVVCYEDGAPSEAVIDKIKSTKCNFINFLLNQAEAYGIKKIIASGYNPETEQGIRFQDADYSEVDIVITNPPYSQFREFIDIMFQNNLKFLVIGSLSAITYKECFEHIQNNEMWLGYAKKIGGFIREDGSLVKKGNDCWYTNLEVSYRHDRMILTEEYSPAKYPKYDNYDAIEVSKQRDIPADYDGVMGLPISFLQNYNPEQFEIIKFRKGDDDKDLSVNGKCPFFRILVKRKDVPHENEN